VTGPKGTEAQKPENPNQLPGLPANAFVKYDLQPDAVFYEQPRLVRHIDDGAIAAVTNWYREYLPADGDILDLMSSWVSHLPTETGYRHVAGLGMNAQELAANPRLTERVVHDLNSNPLLPWADDRFDAATLCVSVQYLQRPVDVFREVARVLRPAAPFIITFSNRCFPTKAVAIWQALRGAQQQQLVGAYLQSAGFENATAREFLPQRGDPLWAVIGSAPQTARIGAPA
jgi:SAM-dependent methyltransferase